MEHPEDEVVALTSELITIDTTNPGTYGGPGPERAAAEWVAARLSEAGYDPEYVESGAPGRGNVIARLPGADPSRGALLIHGHLDVVPADPAEWTVHPFGGEVRDGFVWGRGAVDMKGMLAMTLAVARHFKRAGVVPGRDLIFAFLADEEAGGVVGAQWLVTHRPGLFAGATEAISEVGGFSVQLGDGPRAYLVETAEKGSMWLRLAARGTSGHGSLLHTDNPIATLARALDRLDRHRFPVVLTDPVRSFLTLSGVPFDERDPEAALEHLGHLRRLIEPTLRDTATATIVSAGTKSNVVPSVARAELDGRTLPGRDEEFRAELGRVLGPGIEVEWDSLPAVATTFDGDLVAAIGAAVDAEDPGARLLPYMLAAGTDAKAFARLGIRHFGFAPLRLPPELDFTALFHGVDERVPVSALRFGTRVLDRLLRTA
ncbi:M20/M25/M40 family metallo-hydrolase [Symbioplanes lichenis]|uniref:M20/M25/M40 family metallo-hydrolase n=1 Tax=Symbioplanes lichenis TaxID=1629072 RepID=UPI0027384F85|nr:M20/M25/M40 family metallo-hydrolase [Actinoplanes lichenis]